MSEKYVIEVEQIDLRKMPFEQKLHYVLSTGDANFDAKIFAVKGANFTLTDDELKKLEKYREN